MKRSRYFSISAALKSLTVVALVTVGIACATSPTGRKQLVLFPEEQMNSMGVQAFQEMKSKQPVERNPTTNTYVKCVADAITSAMAEQRQWEVVVFADESANAFALPGGKIGVHTGLLKVAQTPDQLAAVIGHEVGHVIARHGNERVSEATGAQLTLASFSALMKDKGPKYNMVMAGLGLGAQFGVLLPHSRTQESEADVIGLELMAKAGFNPQESVELWKNMGKAGGGGPPEFMSTHPSHGTRMENLQANMGQAMQHYQATTQRPNCKR